MALFLELCSHILIPSVLLKRPVRWKMYLSNTCRFWTATLYGSCLETLLIWFQRELLQTVFCVVRPQEKDLSWTQWNAAFAIAMEPLVGTDIRISHVFVLELGTSSGGVPWCERETAECMLKGPGDRNLVIHSIHLMLSKVVEQPQEMSGNLILVWLFWVLKVGWWVQEGWCTHLCTLWQCFEALCCSLCFFYDAVMCIFKNKNWTPLCLKLSMTVTHSAVTLTDIVWEPYGWEEVT